MANYQHIKNLFEEMSDTYGFVNLLASFGFAALWRKQCLDAIQVHGDCLDLMTGMGELIPGLHKRGARSAVGVDLSPKMCHQARKHKNCAIWEMDFFDNTFEDESFDTISCSFGLKTLYLSDLVPLANEVTRLLRPGGQFSFIEISVPYRSPLCVPYMFYLNKVIPLIGKACLGNPDNYRQLGKYTERFVSCYPFYQAFVGTGMLCSYKEHFFGCATAVTGLKPLSHGIDVRP